MRRNRLAVRLILATALLTGSQPWLTGPEAVPRTDRQRDSPHHPPGPTPQAAPRLAQRRRTSPSYAVDGPEDAKPRVARTPRPSVQGPWCSTSPCNEAMRRAIDTPRPLPISA